MNRKLHNTVTALFATSGLLALSLVVGHPVEGTAPQMAYPTSAEVVRIEAAARTLEARADALDRALSAEGSAVMPTLSADPADKSRPRTSHRHRGRQSVAMPFFSFFPKG